MLTEAWFYRQKIVLTWLDLEEASIQVGQQLSTFYSLPPPHPQNTCKSCEWQNSVQCNFFLLQPNLPLPTFLCSLEKCLWISPFSVMSNSPTKLARTHSWFESKSSCFRKSGFCFCSSTSAEACSEPKPSPSLRFHTGKLSCHLKAFVPLPTGLTFLVPLPTDPL